MARLEYISLAVLEKKFKICQRIRGQGGHIRYQQKYLVGIS